MPDRAVFCNSPWYELHIYWDGALAFCCHATPNLPYDQSDKKIYNIKNMSIREWYDSEPMRRARMNMMSDRKWDHCARCWHEESVSGTSRRHRSNQKSVIFTKQNFNESYQQSPGFSKFDHSQHNQGQYQGLPIDLHVDLGNYCNLACKMCNPQASSRIAGYHKSWNIQQEVLSDWTKDDQTWSRFKQELVEIPNLKNIHFMGGETVIQPRFADLVDHLISHGRTDVCMSFVTNGTVFDLELVRNLKRFPRVGLEISIESLDTLNEYTRQGTDNAVVIENIKKYLAECNNSSITVTLRPAPSLLTVRSYWQVIEFALQHGLVIKSNICTDPDFLAIPVLPRQIRQTYRQSYTSLVEQYELGSIDLGRDYNESDPNNYKITSRNQIDQILNLLDLPDSDNQPDMIKALVRYLSRWDQAFGFDARDTYPEMQDILDAHGYLSD